MDIARLQHARHQHFSYHGPFVQSGRAFHGDAHSIQHGQILFFTAGDESTFFAGNVFSSHYQGIDPVDHSFDLGGDGIPVNRHGKNKGVGLQDGRGNFVEIVVKGAGFSGGKTGFAGTAAADLHHGRVKAGDRMPFFPGPL